MPLNLNDPQLAHRLGEHIAALTSAGPRHPENPNGVSAALSYITATLEELGYQVEQETYGERPHEMNLLASINAEAQRDILEIGAHWDTVPQSPGADDNASGVAGLLELARTYADVTLRRPVRLCFFAEEEIVGCRGSTAHLHHVIGRGEPVEGAIILEMIGYRDSSSGAQRWPDTVPVAGAMAQLPAALRSLITPDQGDFIAAVGSTTSGDYLAALAEGTSRLTPPLPILPLAVPSRSKGHVSRSDHAPYWAAGLKGVMVTDTAEFRNPHYHQPSDTPQILDLEFAAEVTRAVILTVHRLAG